MHHLFISYSRQDKAFVERLSTALVAHGKTTWVDWQDIPPTATFMDEIRSAIDAADSFLFVISPASCHSPICRQEVGHAAASHKRLIPIVYESTPAGEVPEEVAPINWIDFGGAGTFDEALIKLTTAIDTDLEWVHAHTELLVRAKEWEQLGHSRSALLRGVELTTAEQHLVAEAGKPPLVVPLQQEFVVASRRDTTRRLRTIIGAVSTALVVTAGLAVLAFWLSRLAETRRQLADEQRQRAEEQTQVANAATGVATEQRQAADVQRQRAEDQTKVAEAATAVANDQRRAADQQRKRAEDQTKVAEAATVVADEQRRVAEVQRNTAEDVARLMTAESLASTDPTSAALVLLELHDPIGRGLAAVQAFRHVAEQPIASAVLRGHSGFTFCGAFSPDAKHVAIGSGDRTVRIWRTDGGGTPIVLRGHNGIVNTVSFNADGRSVISTSGDGARIWSADGSGSAIVLAGVRSAKFSPDGSRVITISADKTARLWSPEGALVSLVSPPIGATLGDAAFAGGQLVAVAIANDVALVLRADQATPQVVLRGHTQAITDAQFSADGSRVMTASRDGTIRVWPADGRGDPVILSGGSTSLATLSGDGSHVASSNGPSVFAWNVATGGAPTVRRSPEFVLFLKLSFDGKRAATFADATNFHLARVWRTEGPDDSVLLAGHEGRVYSTTFSLDGTKILTTGTDGTGRVWPTAGSREPLVLGDHDVTINDAEFDSDGTSVVTADDKAVRVWALDVDHAPIVFTGHTKPIQTAAFSPDSRRVVSASDDGTARVWSLDDRTPPIVFDDHSGLVRWARFVSGGNAVVTESEDRAWRIWPMTAPRTPKILRSDPGEAWVTLSADGSRARAASTNGRCHEVALDGHGPVAGVVAAPQASCAFSSDGSRVATYRPNATTIDIWNATDARPLGTLQGQAGNIVNAAFSPDGRRFATASSDRAARVWQLDGSAMPAVLSGHTDMVRSVSFSPDGSLVLTSAEDGTARVWYADRNDRPLVLPLPGDQKIVMHASFSPDGTRVLTRTFTISHRPNDVRVFRVDTGALVAFLRASTTACLMPTVRTRAFGEPANVASARFEACEAAKLAR